MPGPGYRSVVGKDLGFTDDDQLLLRGVAVGGSGSASLPDVRTVTAAGSITVDVDTDDHILVNKTVGAATTVLLPPSAGRDEGRHIKIVDKKGDALTNNITIVPDGAETIGTLSSYVIKVNKGSVTIWPDPAGGWYV